jgi:ribosomal protein S18 acetylase RimI-like enzyme
MKVPDIKNCEAIVNASDPWKRLKERVNFRPALGVNRTGTRAYVCRCGKAVAGFVLFSPAPVFARGGYLRAIAVAPEFHGQGVGRRLLVFAEKMTARQSKYLFLCVSSFNRRGQAFYRHLGYERAGNLPGLIRPEFTEYIYWKKLAGR